MTIQPINSIQSVDWSELLMQARNGQDQAREELFRCLSVRLRLILQFRIRGMSREDQQDMVQSVLLVVAEKLEQLDSRPHLFALKVLQNKIGDYLRERNRPFMVPLGSDGLMEYQDLEDFHDAMVVDLVQVQDPSQQLEGEDLVKVIRREIGKLSAPCQAIFAGLFEGKTVGEILLLLREIDPELQRSTFDKRLFDCRKKLRNAVKGEL